MRKVDDKKLYRVIDANINRAKEGLRVCEDVCRFLHNQEKKTQRYKLLRHKLTTALSALSIQEVVEARDIGGDVGKKSSATEFRRKNVADIFYANSQRVKESIRVLEEFTKLLNGRMAEDLKKIRYKVYAIEREVIQEL